MHGTSAQNACTKCWRSLFSIRQIVSLSRNSIFKPVWRDPIYYFRMFGTFWSRFVESQSSCLHYVVVIRRAAYTLHSGDIFSDSSFCPVHNSLLHLVVSCGCLGVKIHVCRSMFWVAWAALAVWLDRLLVWEFSREPLENPRESKRTFRSPTNMIRQHQKLQHSRVIRVKLTIVRPTTHRQPVCYK